MERITRIFRAQLSELDSMMEWARVILINSGLGEAAAKKFILAVEEALINIVQYAYPHPPGLIEVTYEVDKGRSEVHFTFSDQGVPFNPLSHDHEPKRNAQIHELKEGGLGIHFIIKMADQVSYKRDGNSNILRLTKTL